MKNEVLIAAVVISVALNFVLPYLAMRWGNITHEHVNPIHGAKSLPRWEQIKHMLADHAELPFTSSLIVAVIVALSVHIACMDEVKKFVKGLL